MLRKYNDTELNPKHWYILVFRKGKPILYSKFFKTKQKIDDFMYNNKLRGLQYMPIRGKQAIEYDLKFYKGRLYILFPNTEVYKYPVDRITSQDKKSFRTKSRRWLRNFKTLPTNHTDFKSPKKK